MNAAVKAATDALNSHDTNIVLTTANALWYRQSAQIKPGYLEANANFFSSTFKPLDFRNVPAAEAEINQWASDQTHGRINDIANGMIDPNYTDLVLANAIYFKGKWEDPFDTKLTKERPFHPAAGAKKNLQMMEMSKNFTYRETVPVIKPCGCLTWATGWPCMSSCPTPAPVRRNCCKP